MVSADRPPDLYLQGPSGELIQLRIGAPLGRGQLGLESRKISREHVYFDVNEQVSWVVYRTPSARRDAWLLPGNTDQ